MELIFSSPPQSKAILTPPDELARRLQPLVGMKFLLTLKTRTDGANLRKLVARTLGQHPLIRPCDPKNYKIVPPRAKGLPRILLEFIDTYIVTTGDTYNLQVWNRNPAADSIQIEYDVAEPLLASEVRFVLVRVDTRKHLIRSILVLTPDYIVERFGVFGKPTIKHQMMITPKTRREICEKSPPIVFHPDCNEIQSITTRSANFTKSRIQDAPELRRILSLDKIRDAIAQQLLGTRLGAAATKNRGQALEMRVAALLGYPKRELLLGGYPDIRHQALEVKVQDSPTVDLGKFSPQFEEDAPGCKPFKTTSIRYLVALTDSATEKVCGLVICPGALLGKYFTYVSGTSFKCQRTIPMRFFDAFEGKICFNPQWPHK